MKSRPCSPRSADGFTLIELMVGMAIMLVITAAALTLSLSTRSIYEADQARTRMQQGVRASKEFLTMDIRQTGERLARSFPAVEILRGEDLPGGAAGDPDELILRRNVVRAVMNSCRDVDGMVQTLYVAELLLPPPPGCTAMPDSDLDGWPDEHKDWSDYREANGTLYAGSKWVWAYIYDPVNRQGEFFKYWQDFPALGTITTAPMTWQNTYLAVNQPRIYLLEERRYRVEDGTLQIVVNGDNTVAVNLVDNVVDFQLLAHFQSKATQDSLSPLDDWTDLRAIEVGLDSRSIVNNEVFDHSWSSLVLPRNVLSQ